MNGSSGVVVLSGVRTPVGGYGGSLKDIPPSELGAMCVREAVSRAGIEPSDVGHCVFGNIIHTDAHDHYLARVAALNGGLPHETPALTLNRLCGSGLQAIITAAQSIVLGDAQAAVGGGAENMSRSPYFSPAMRWGARMNDTTLVDAMVAALSDPFDDCHMGVTAENVAKKWNVSRADQDALAVESHHRAAKAIEAGYFKEQILPVEIRVKRDTVKFDTDETVRGDSSVEKLGKLRPVFEKEGSVTPGNASSINDAGAAVVLMDEELAKKRGLKPLGKLVGYSYAGVDPKYMGIGPVPAVRNLMERTGLKVSDFDVLEVNEAFA
ncbi:MAG: acetyl-CoA C-acyltransferase, partial [Planctomycetota bacterium]